MGLRVLITPGNVFREAGILVGRGTQSIKG